MPIQYYSELVSPFVQTKVLLHQEKLQQIDHDKLLMPVTCEIDLTDGFCNNKCKHCFFGTNHKTDPIFIDTKVIKQIIKELYDNGCKAIEFTGGGEPTTHPDIYEILEYSISLGLDVGLITNGLLLDKIIEIAKYLKFIRVSLDASCRETYNIVHGVDCFEIVINNIKTVLKTIDRNKVGIGFLIVPDNISDIYQASVLAKCLGVRFIQYRPATLPYEVKQDIWSQAISEIKKSIEHNASDTLQIFDAGVKWIHVNEKRRYNKCHTSVLVAVIKANGDMPLCVLKRNDSNSIIGNIYNGGFMKNWFSERHSQLINNIDVNHCPKPCKHDSYNIVYEALKQDMYHKNFI